MKKRSFICKRSMFIMVKLLLYDDINKIKESKYSCRDIGYNYDQIYYSNLIKTHLKNK